MARGVKVAWLLPATLGASASKASGLKLVAAVGAPAQEETTPDPRVSHRRANDGSDPNKDQHDAAYKCPRAHNSEPTQNLKDAESHPTQYEPPLHSAL